MGAIHKKVIHHKNHAFAGHFFNQPTFCAVCHKFLWGVFGEQGYLCGHCSMAVHRDCYVLILAQCVGVRTSAELTSKLALQLAIKHTFDRSPGRGRAIVRY